MSVLCVYSSSYTLEKFAMSHFKLHNNSAIKCEQLIDPNSIMTVR